METATPRARGDAFIYMCSFSPRDNFYREFFSLLYLSSTILRPRHSLLSLAHVHTRLSQLSASIKNAFQISAPSKPRGQKNDRFAQRGGPEKGQRGTVAMAQPARALGPHFKPAAGWTAGCPNRQVAGRCPSIEFLKFHAGTCDDRCSCQGPSIMRDAPRNAKRSHFAPPAPSGGA